MNIMSYGHQIKHEVIEKIYLKAICLGALLDFFLSTLISVAFGMFFALSLPSDTPPDPNLIGNYYAIFVVTNPLIMSMTLALGLFSSFLGGALASLMAKDAPLLNAGIIGVVTFISAILFFDGRLPLWYNLLGIILVVPMTLLGGYVVTKIR